MSKSVSIGEARDQFAALIHQVENNEPVEVTRRGKPVAVILSVRQYRRLQAGESGFWPAYERFRRRHDLAELAIKPEIFEGVRDRTPGRDVSL